MPETCRQVFPCASLQKIEFGKLKPIFFCAHCPDKSMMRMDKGELKISASSTETTPELAIAGLVANAVDTIASLTPLGRFLTFRHRAKAIVIQQEN